jgi:hypothetical protein
LNYNGAQLIDVPSYSYNCHAYAWHVVEGGSRVWIGFNTATAHNIYWTDGSYIEVPENMATKVNYHPSGNHSAIRINTDWYQSKWGASALVRHRPNAVPPIYQPALPKKYYIRTPTITGQFIFVCGSPNDYFLSNPHVKANWSLPSNSGFAFVGTHTNTNKVTVAATRHDGQRANLTATINGINLTREVIACRTNEVICRQCRRQFKCGCLVGIFCGWCPGCRTPCPNPSIVGPSHVCPVETYTLMNLPHNAQIVWDLNSTYLFSKTQINPTTVQVASLSSTGGAVTYLVAYVNGVQVISKHLYACAAWQWMCMVCGIPYACDQDPNTCDGCPTCGSPCMNFAPVSANFTKTYIVHPNPVASTLHFRATEERSILNPASQPATYNRVRGKVMILGQTGRLALMRDIPNLNEDFEVDVSSLPEGMYIVSVIQDGKVVYAQNIIVKH